MAWDATFTLKDSAPELKLVLLTTSGKTERVAGLLRPTWVLEDSYRRSCPTQWKLSRKNDRRLSKCCPVSWGRQWSGRLTTAGMFMSSGCVGVALCRCHWCGCRGLYWRSSWTETPCCWWMRRGPLLFKASTASPKGNHVCPKVTDAQWRWSLKRSWFLIGKTDKLTEHKVTS